MRGLDSKTEQAVALFEQRMVSTFGMTSEDFQDERARGPVSAAYLQNAIGIVERSGIHEQLAAWEFEERKTNTGRKSILPMTAVLPLMLLHIQMGHGIVYNDIAATLHSRFRFKHLEMLGIQNVPSDQRDWYHRFWRALNRILSLIDPYPLPRDRPLERESMRNVWLDSPTATRSHNTCATLPASTGCATNLCSPP